MAGLTVLRQMIRQTPTGVHTSSEGSDRMFRENGHSAWGRKLILTRSGFQDRAGGAVALRRVGVKEGYEELLESGRSFKQPSCTLRNAWPLACRRDTRA
jgi:hypothetical protein